MKLGASALVEPHQRKFTKASVVCFGCSSSIQWPESLTITTITLLAANFICSPNAAPRDLSPPMESTGIVNLVFDICSKSLAVCVHETKYCHDARIRPGRE